MSRGAYYNEIDPGAAAWLRELIKAGEIAPGDVDERSIRDVRPDDLAGYTQCHFFAGIGGWSLALRLAGWPDERPVWTGSCPCQPFSAAGKRGGTADDRHLWPEFYRLIGERRPGVVFGEQVASKDGLAWLDLVCADLENAGYAIGAIDLCAAGIGAPHIRQRLWFVADANEQQRHGRGNARTAGRREPAIGGGAGLMGDTGSPRTGRHPGAAPSPEAEAGSAGRADGRDSRDGALAASATCGAWAAADWIPCRDGKWRPVEPGTFPLAHGIPGRVGLLRGYGNAIVPQVAAEVISAYMELEPAQRPAPTTEGKP